MEPGGPEISFGLKSLNFTLEEPFEEGCSDEPWLEPELMWLETLPVLWSE